MITFDMDVYSFISVVQLLKITFSLTRELNPEQAGTMKYSQREELSA